jgi:hypothetical protein
MSEETEEHTEAEKRTLLLLEHMRYSDDADRGLVLFLAAQLDIYLGDILKSFLIDHSETVDLFEGPYAPFGSFSGKIKAAFVLGLITQDEAARAHAVRKVRNVFAHEIKASFVHPDVVKLCAKPPIFDGRLVDRDAFLHMGMNAALPLLYRSIGVRKAWKREVLTIDAANGLRNAN